MVDLWVTKIVLGLHQAPHERVHPINGWGHREISPFPMGGGLRRRWSQGESGNWEIERLSFRRPWRGALNDVPRVMGIRVGENY